MMANFFVEPSKMPTPESGWPSTFLPLQHFSRKVWHMHRDNWETRKMRRK